MQPKQLPGISCHGVAEHSRSQTEPVTCASEMKKTEEHGSAFLLPSMVPGIEAHLHLKSQKKEELREDEQSLGPRAISTIMRGNLHSL